jgi:hypothetical protein
MEFHIFDMYVIPIIECSLFKKTTLYNVVLEKRRTGTETRPLGGTHMICNMFQKELYKRIEG